MPQKTYMYDTQWNQLINAISNQTITVDLSNINSDNVLNLSDIIGNNLTSALNTLNIKTKSNVFLIPFKNANINFIKTGDILLCSCNYTSQISLIQNTWAYIGTVPEDFPYFNFLSVPLVNGDVFAIRRQPSVQYIEYIYSGVSGNVWLQGSGSTIIK